MPIKQRTINSDQKQKPKIVPVNGTYTVLPYDSYIILSSTDDDTTKTITLPNVIFVTLITIRMTVRTNTGSYIIPVTGGNLTFDNAGESAIIISDPSTNPCTWQVASVRGATII